MALIISNKHKYIFFHLPKNAGTSISNKLFEIEDFSFLKKTLIHALKIIGNKKKAYNFFFCKNDFKIKLFNSHSSVLQLEKIIHQKTFKEYYKFGVIRNPFDRQVSRFLYFNKINNDFKYNTFKEFVLWDIESQKNSYALKQKKFLLNSSGNIGVNKILRFENLDNDFEELKIKLNLKLKNSKLKKKNSTSNFNYREFYDSDTQKIVENFCKEDLDFFNYSF